MVRYEVRRERMEPLWDRIDRNRVELAWFVGLFGLATTLFLTIVGTLAVGVAGLLGGLWSSRHGFDPSVWDSIAGVLPLVPLLAAGSTLLYVAWALARDERWFARRLGAYVVPQGEMLEAKHALKDMAIAAGIPVAPAFHLIETPNVNAFVFGRRGRRAIVGVTRGLVERLSASEQRAVFANLVARLRSGDTIWASGVTALMAPLWGVRAMQLRPDEVVVLGRTRRLTELRSQYPAAVRGARVLLSPLAVPFMALSFALVSLSELLSFGHRRTHLRHAETADAEGMLLLKDPQPMLSALEKCVRYNNFVPTAGPGMTQLFYCWTGDSSTDDDEDPEMRRVVRLREVLGVEGMTPALVAPNREEYLVAPSAPRLDWPSS